MKEITVRYAITLGGTKHEYIDTFEAYNVRDAHFMISSIWHGVKKIDFIEDTVVEL